MKPNLTVVRALLLRHRRPLIVTTHLVLVALSSHLAFLLRFDGNVPAWAETVERQTILWLAAIRAITFAPLGLYQGLWRYTSVWDLRNIVAGVGLSSAIFYALVRWGLDLTSYPRSIFFIDALLLVCFMSGIRLIHRVYREFRQPAGGRRVVIFGAGDAGEMIVRDMKSGSTAGYEPIGFVDDDPTKIGQRIHGVPVLGTRTDLPRIMAKRRPQEVLIAIPRAEPAIIRAVVQELESYKVRITTLPSLRERLDRNGGVNQIRDLAVEDLLSRAPIGLDPKPVREMLKGRRVLVTGAGGSIGSELSRQIAALHPDVLILYERYENSLHAITTALADGGYAGVTRAIVGDVTDAQRLNAIFAAYRPHIVFHAAAHKHVPMMEDNPCEAVKNNVVGTRLVAETAERHGVERLILISSDKAANPTSVMGATKRIAELIVQTQGIRSGARFCTVRFGNVLATNGSVVPRFREQIRSGGPVTVTHPEMQRFFMLIAEAVQLVLHAAARGQAGATYVLDTGEQLRVVDMARNLIRLAGFVPDAEVPITFVGLRPGEKLVEELVGDDEEVRPSGISKILLVRSRQLPERGELEDQLSELETLARQEDGPGVIARLGAIVPTFRSRSGAADAGPALRVPEPQRISDRQRARPAPAAAPSCPICRSSDLHRSRVRSLSERIRKRFTSWRLHRCRDCGWRGWMLHVPEDHERGFSLGSDVTPPDLSSVDTIPPMERPATASASPFPQRLD